MDFVPSSDHFAHDLAQLLHWRRDVRHFRCDPLGDGVLDALLASADCAPSVGNSRPWRFVRVVSPDLRERLAGHVDAEAARAGAIYRDAPDRAAHYARLKLHGLREAPEVLAVFCDGGAAAGHGLGRATMPETLDYSVVLAIHTMWLMAKARGVGLGWVSICDPRCVHALLGVPAGWRMIALLCLGLAQSPADVPELHRAGWQANTDWRSRVSDR
jgi:5,6-dimethylbenzimidazole synthase